MKQSDMRQVHFCLNPGKPEDKEVIDIIDQIPCRGAKEYICLLIRQSGGYFQTMAAQAGIQVRPVVPVQSTRPVADDEESGLPVHPGQLPGQMGIDDVMEADEDDPSPVEGVAGMNDEDGEIPEDIMEDFMSLADGL